MKKHKLFKLLSILGVLFFVYIVAGYIYNVKTQGALIENPVIVPEKFADEFSRVVTKRRYEDMAHATFMSPEDRRLNWQVFDGKYLLVNFWATWCPPCVLELPSLDKLKKKFEGRGVEVIAISMDTRRSHADIKAFLDNRGIGTFAAYLDDAGEVKKNIYMRGLPTSYLLSPAGKVLYIFEGDADWSSSSAVHFFERLLNVKSQ